MSTVAVVYWSQTGNTKAMAEALADAAQTKALSWEDFSADKVSDYDALAFGCPAMGSEELDPNFQELWEACVTQLGDKPVALFGSYDWGTGEWMDTWKQEATGAGVNVVATVIANLEPDDDAKAELQKVGAQLAE
ncbi:MAG: flavodoxin domain-containing protein [Atopobiaceae bacterium]|jgi:flavodoxin I